MTKYLHRAGLKPDAEKLEDLKKAHWYMARWVAWMTHGKRLWKVALREPDIVFEPQVLR